MRAGVLDERRPAPPGGGGTSISTSSSSGSRAVISGAWKSSSALDERPPRARADVEARVERGQRDRQLGGRVGVGDRAADRAAVADRRVGDVGDGAGEQRPATRDDARALERRLAGERADAQRPARPPHGREVVDPVEVHDRRRAREAEVEQRHERLAARER